MTMTMAARIICRRPMAMWFPSKNAGSGHPHIVCPMEKYMRTMRKPSDQMSLFLRAGVSWSSRAASSAAKLPADALPEAVSAAFRRAP